MSCWRGPDCKTATEEDDLTLLRVPAETGGPNCALIGHDGLSARKRAGLKGFDRIEVRNLAEGSLPPPPQPSKLIITNAVLYFSRTQWQTQIRSPLSVNCWESIASEQTFVQTENVELRGFSWLWTKYHLTPQCCYPLRFAARLSSALMSGFPLSWCGLSFLSRPTRWLLVFIYERGWNMTPKAL